MKHRRTHVILLLIVSVTLTALLLVGKRRLDRHRMEKIDFIVWVFDNDKKVGITPDELLDYLALLNTDTYITNGTLHIHYTSSFTNRLWTVDITNNKRPNNPLPSE